MRKIYLIFAVALFFLSAVIFFFSKSGNPVLTTNYSPTQQSTSLSLNNCNPNDTQCFSNVILTILNNTSIPNALNQLKLYYSAHPESETACHMAAHKLGEAAWVKYGNISKIYQVGSGICSFGFIHGALTKSLVGLSTTKVYNLVKNLCAPISKINQAAADECDHGLGHAGVVHFLNFDDAAKLCDSLSTERSQGSCIQGSIMEYSSSFPANPLLAANLSEKIYLSCLTLNTDSAKQGCIFGASSPSIRSDGTKGDGSLALKRCESLPKAYLENCINGIGTAIPSVSNWAPKISASVCQKMPTAFIHGCIESASKTFASVFLSIDKSSTFCNTLDNENKSFCLKNIPKLEALISSLKPERN